jgi:hypothetical protein
MEYLVVGRILYAIAGGGAGCASNFGPPPKQEYMQNRK